MMASPCWAAGPLKSLGRTGHKVLAHRGAARIVKRVRPLIGILRALFDNLPPDAVLLAADLAPGTQDSCALLEGDLCTNIKQYNIDRILDERKNVAAPHSRRHRAISTRVDNSVFGSPNLVRITIQSAHHPGAGLSQLQSILAVSAPDMDDDTAIQVCCHRPGIRMRRAHGTESSTRK